jgi:pimeloyl-ACP methyl ester carboxylesterase
MEVLMSSSHKRMQSPRPAVLSVLLCCLAGSTAGGCEPEEPILVGSLQNELQAAGPSLEARVLDFERERLVGDVYHYSFLLRVADSPNARLRIHRVTRESASGRPRPTTRAAMLLHGDFSTFASNFVPSRVSDFVPPRHGLAVYLAERGIDVWGVDRRWATAPLEGVDLSDFADMGFSSAIEDARLALLFARWTRGITGAGWDRMILAGFSRGGHLAYAYAAEESQRPPAQRHIRGIVPIDIYAAIAPQDEAFRQGACQRRDEERALLDAGVYDSDNRFFIDLGTLAATAPSAPSPLWDGYTNRDVLLTLVAQTSLFYAPTASYHLMGGAFAEGMPTALRYSSEAVAADWLASAPPRQALAELADSDALWCGEEPLPLATASYLGDIQVPLFYLGAAGGVGEHGVYATTLVGSADVSTHVVRRLDSEHEPEDFGHADLLYAADAPTLAWQPLAEWLLRH